MKLPKWLSKYKSRVVSTITLHVNCDEGMGLNGCGSCWGLHTLQRAH